ncbi:MAG: P27 family phage terminase small subunit, partial [Nitrospira sp.]
VTSANSESFVRASGSLDLEPPSYLMDEIAIREWLTVAPNLLRRGLLDETMRPLLAGYCNALARSVRAEQVLAREGRYYRTVSRAGSATKRRHAAVQDAEEGWAPPVCHFAKQLGISSSSCAKLHEKEVRAHSMFK